MVDLNSDMGESFGPWVMGDDEGVMRSITSANIACGFHAGDPRIMNQAVNTAKSLGVGVGAHPSFPDLAGFGRRNMSLSYNEAMTDVLYQIGALAAFCRRHGVPLQHVKPHGQLNNMAMEDRGLAEAIADAVFAYDPNLIVVAYGGELQRALEDRGLPVAHEVYADRAYQSHGLLVSRKVPGALIHDPDTVVERAVRMVLEQEVETVEGHRIPIKPDTICVHGDTPGAADLAKRLREGLLAAGIAVRPMAEVVRTHASRS